ncbi:unnamed protein product [Bemisia tabaci]|uniref:Uncharacterized protein n=1 Tax=Bemisia tabaci TaxID=7038 RepID=A0A9P0EXH5_BEMTA|nr:unnamed protein product [Bemisia tabaci]
MSLKFLRSYVNWNLLLQDPVLTSKVAEAGKSDNLSYQLVEEISSYIDFDEMSNNPNTPENILHNHSHRLDFRRLLLNNCHLSIDFIRSHGVALNKCWDLISSKILLSEKEMEEFSYLLDWRIASRYQKMSERFIKKFKHKVDWENIVKYQDVSNDFILENCPKD